MPEEEVKFIWRYRTREEEHAIQEEKSKLKDKIWHFSCQGWFEKFRKVSRVSYDPETNSFEYFRYSHDNIHAKDFVDPPVLTGHELKAIEREKKENGYVKPTKFERYQAYVANKEVNKPYYLPYYTVDLSEAFLEDFNDRDFEEEKQARIEAETAYKADRTKREKEREKTHKRKLTEEQQQIRMIKRLRHRVAKSHSEYDLDSILRRIPGFKFKFTKAQLQMINKSKQRTVVIGRSGTGKSTCAILKMLAIDLLFICKKVLKTKRTKVEAKDLTPTGIRHLFLTSSRVLADDLRVFYENLMTALK